MILFGLKLYYNNHKLTNVSNEVFVFVTLIYFIAQMLLSLLTILIVFQGYEGSLLKVTSKNGKTASVSIFY